MDQAVSRASSLQLAAPSGSLAIVPQNFGELIAFADRMAESQFVPAHLRRKPGDCMAVCLQALRWGMDPFMVAQKSYVVRDGATPAYEAQLIAAVIYSRAPLVGRLDIEWSGEPNARICTVTGRIIGDPKPKVRRVDSRTITTKNSPLWKSDPDQQIAYYSVRAWARLYCPDVLMGVYAPDELNSEGAIDITPEKPAAAQVQEIITRDPLADFSGEHPSTAGTGGSGEDPPPAAAHGEDGVVIEPPEPMPVPDKGAPVKQWQQYRDDLVAAAKGAPSRNWLADFEQANHEGMTQLAEDFPKAAAVLRAQIAGRAAELGA